MNIETCEHCGGMVMIGRLGLVCENRCVLAQSRNREQEIRKRFPERVMEYKNNWRATLAEVGENAKTLNEDKPC